MVDKVNKPIPQVPFQPIKVDSEPFERIVVDCVGPLPRTRRGNQYLITVMCPTTRYPEAFPVGNISANTVVSKLIDMFTKYGISKVIQTDRETNFTSEPFQEVLDELDIRSTMSSAYHPESQGVLERWYQTV